MEYELARRQFERLLNTLEIDPALAGAVVDWLDPDTDLRFPTGGEDVVYSGSDPPYRTANSMITSTSELMAIAGFDREAYRKLAPYVTVLPHGTKINVNTASDVVLASLSDDIDISTAGALVDERADMAFVDIDMTFEGLVDPGYAAGDRRRQRAFFIDRNRDARVKSADDALGAATRS